MFSVIIPLYNKENHILKTLESVFNQSCSDYEILIIDDGSYDKSLKIVKNIVNSKLTIFTKANGDVSSARNFGIARAKHDYIAFLDADDLWDPEYLSNMSRLIEEFPMCGMYTSAYRLVGSEKILDQCVNVPKGIIKDYFETILYNPITWTSATVCKRIVFEQVGMFPLGMISGEDLYMWSKVAIKYQVAFVPSVLASYNIKDSGLSLRSNALDTSMESWQDFYEPGSFYKNEYIAKKALLSAVRFAFSENNQKSKDIEKFFKYTILFKKEWRKIFVLNRIPKFALGLVFRYLKYRNNHYLKGISKSRIKFFSFI